MPLGGGQASEESLDKLRNLSPRLISEDSRPGDDAIAKAMLAALWLHHNELDASHHISQELETPTGSLLHGIMHRREGDFGNAKYWFSRVGDHPIHPRLATEASQIACEIGTTARSAFLAEQTQWYPNRFVDLVEEVIGSGSNDEQLAVEIQRIEWWILFDWLNDQITEA